ncbi:MAG: MFS transporter [Firmicutes bacterium]|nr:MFS transporter [Bacillota bacterium]
MGPIILLGMLEFVRCALVISLLPLYGQYAAGFSLGTVGAAISLHYLSDNLFRLPAGWVNDRVGGKRLLLIGMVLSGLGIYLMYARWNTPVFLLGAVLFGLGVSPIWPVVTSTVAASTSMDKIGQAMSRVFMAWLIGSGLGPVLVNFLIGQSYALAFWSLLGVMGSALLITAFSRFPLAAAEASKDFIAFLRELLQEFISLRVLYPGMLMQTVSIGILLPVIAVYGRTVFDLSAEEFSYLLIGGGAFTVLLLAPAGKLADSLGVKRPLVIGFFGAAFLLALLPLQRTLIPALVIAALIGMAYAFILPAWNGLIARVLSPERRGSMWAVFMTIEGLGTALGAYAGGMVWEGFGQQAPFFLSALILVVMAVFYWSSDLDRLMRVNGNRPEV